MRPSLVGDMARSGVGESKPKTSREPLAALGEVDIRLFEWARRVTSDWNASRSVLVRASSASSLPTVVLSSSSSFVAAIALALPEPPRDSTCSSRRSRSCRDSPSAFSSVLRASRESCSSLAVAACRASWVEETAAREAVREAISARCFSTTTSWSSVTVPN